MRHRDRVIIVTGGARGCGRVYAERLRAAGAAVVIADIDGPGARQAAAELGCHSITTDIADPQSIERLASEVMNTYGKIDGLVANAAIANSVGGKTYDEIDIADWRRILDVNVTGTWLTVKAVAPHMQKARRGSIVTVSSDTAHWGSPRLLHYVTSKGAVEAFTRAMARELGPSQVRINCIAPGLLNNDATSGVPADKREWNIRERALQRDGSPEDVAGLVSFLLSEDAEFITGQTILVNGGLVLQ